MPVYADHSNPVAPVRVPPREPGGRLATNAVATVIRAITDDLAVPAYEIPSDGCSR